MRWSPHIGARSHSLAFPPSHVAGSRECVPHQDQLNMSIASSQFSQLRVNMDVIDPA